MWLIFIMEKWKSYSRSDLIVIFSTLLSLIIYMSFCFRRIQTLGWKSHQIYDFDD